MKRIIAKTVNTNVLVVDDNEVNLLIAKTTLQQYGINVTAVTSGAEALDKLASGSFDLVILDCVMPEMSGHETAQKMREMKGSLLPVVTYTANNADSVREEFADINIIDVLSKPLDTIELTKVLLKTLPNEKLPDKDKTIAELKLLGSDDIGKPQETSSFRKRLDRIPGLDHEAGIHYAADSEENYVNVLRAAAESMKTCAMKVTCWQELLSSVPGTGMSDPGTAGDTGSHPEGAAAACPLSSDEIQQFRVVAHSMKGVCASIGMSGLSAQSAEFEKILISMEGGDFSVSLPDAASYSNSLHNAGNAIADAVSDYDMNTRGQAGNRSIDMSPEEFRDLCKRTIEQAKLFDIDAVKESLNTLAGAASTDDALAKINAALDAAGCFDYKKAAALLEEAAAL